MKTRIFIFAITLTFSLFFGLGTASADGVLIVEPPSQAHIYLPPMPHPILRPEPLPVKYHRVQIDIENQVATTSIDQVFKNDYDVDLEGTYIFPLPEEAAITDFAMYIDGKRVSGEILNKDEARKTYEDIVRRMKDPGLLEYIGRNMFKARVYPIPRHGEKRIELVYQQTLSYDAGTCRYVYPLSTERFSPKPLEEVTISAKVKSRIPIKSIYSPSHEVSTKVEQFQAGCSYEAKDVTPDKDFILYYTVSKKDLGLNLLCHRTQGEEGYFLMLLSPGELEGRTIAKDIVFVLDTSGSMQGDKIKQAKEALRFCVNGLGQDDRFNIIGFSEDVNSYKDALVFANKENLKGALDFIDGFQARGGTNINDALLSALKIFDDSRKPRMVVFLTDGLPTVGITNIKDITKNLSQANKTRTRTFVFGVGFDVNTHLLDKIAQDHKGTSEYVRPNENIEVKVSSFYSKITEPILADIKLDFGKIRTEEIYPVALPDIFKGSQLLMMGRYKGDGATAVTLKGYIDGKEKKFVYEDRFLTESKGNDFIPRIWATRKIGYLMSEIRLKGENKELVDEIIKLSKEHGIMTPYTSYLIVQRDKRRDNWVHPLEAKKVKLAGMRYSQAMERAVGSSAVSSSKDIASLRRRTVAQSPTLKTVKHAGEKAFYLRDGIWVDSKYEEGAKIRNVKYLSEEYFNLLRRNPGLGKYFSIAKNIIVVFEQECYRVTD